MMRMKQKNSISLAKLFTFFNESVLEAAKTLDNAKQNNLAIYYGNNTRGSGRIVLVDFKHCLKLIGDFANLQDELDSIRTYSRKPKQRLWSRYSLFFTDWYGITYEEFDQMLIDNLIEMLGRLLKYLGNEKGVPNHDFRNFVEEQSPEKQKLIATWSADEVEQIQDQFLQLLSNLKTDQRDLMLALGTQHPTNALLLAAALERSIAGYMVFRKPQGECSEPDVWNVEISVASKGWGPLMYDMAMSLIYPNYLIADRGGSSSSAEKVWNHYLNNRTDVEKEMMVSSISKGKCMIPKYQNWSTPHNQNAMKKLEGNIYAYKFRLKNPRLDWEALEANSLTFKSELLNQFNMKVSEEAIWKAAIQFFSSRYASA